MSATTTTTQMSMPSTSSVAGGPPDTNRQLFSVKQERHDEAEILELAAKMMESHKAQMTKAAQQQAMQQQMRSVNVINSTGQTNILNYFPRKTSQQGSSSLQAAGTSASIVPTTTPAAASAVTATNGGTYNGKQPNGETTSSSASPDGSTEKKPCDEESQKGHFGWHTFNKSIYIPYILRSGEKYCAVRIVESKLLNKYLNYLHHDIYSCTCVRSYYITEAEGRLLNEINHKHSESHFGREMFTVKDLVVRLSDVSKFWTFLDVCYKKLLMGNNGQGQSEKCGFIRINKESVVPYTVRDGQKFVPLFYFEGETENLKLKADNLSGWDLSYLKFCCKVQGIRNELFASDKVAVISLTDIKSYFPPGTQFEDYWPNKVVDTQLLVQKSNANSSVHWTRQPTAPPPKPTSSTQSKAAPTRKQATAVSYGNAAMSQVNMQQRLPGQMGSTNTPVVSNVWSNLTSVSGLNLTPGQQEHVLRMAQVAQQAQSQRAYPTTRSQVQNIMQRQPYNVNFPPVAAAAAAMSAMTGLSSSSNQVPPPLIRGAQQAPTSHHMSSCVTGPPSLRSSNSLTINPVATPSHLLPPPPPYSASSNHLHEYLLANVSLASSPKNNHYASGGSNKTTYSTSNYNNNNTDYLLNNNILNAIYSKTAVTSIANHPVGSPARASPNQSHSVSSSGQPKQPPPPLIPMPNTSASDAFSAIRDTLQQLRSLKSLTTTFLPQNIPIPDPYGSPSPSSHAAGTTSPFSLHPLSMVPAAQSPVDIKPQPPTFSPSLANRQTKSVTMSATDVIDLSSPPRSAASLLHHQQQQQQQHHHQQHHQQQQQLQQQQQILQQQRGQQILTNGRCNTNAQNLMHGAPSAASAAAQVAAMQQHQRQSSVDASRLSAIPEMVSHNGNVPYKMQKAQIDGCTVPCINMKAYTYTDLLMTLADLKDIFFPHMTLENCRKVLDVLNVELYKGNRSQLKVFQEYGHHGMENMALVLVQDIINFMPQLKYMVRSQTQEQPAHKRARIS
ncbi:methylcytosine dioxygenase TET isoform X3 [Lutzomyia longipalpis]|uniref:methylcytosine dioxygenase TET isoform X3 n=1 Tax=Lutzomyia longipalpis TaxID=7200 RepID=UPI002484088C|nr:methylcytosine dioxygenase TET isoform X3 [Lutzomyia longipalpis]